MRLRISLASGLAGSMTLHDSAGRDAQSAPVVAREVTNAQAVAEVVRAMLGNSLSERESVFVLCVNARRRLISCRQLTIGSMNASIVHPRDVYRQAIGENAAAIVLAHNHPSDDPSPSVEDHQVTMRMAEAGKLLGIELLDHVVVSATGYVSMKEKGWLV